MAGFYAPPMPRDDWENLLRFDREVRRETGGCGIIDVKALMMIRDRNIEALKKEAVTDRGQTGCIDSTNARLSGSNPCV